MLNIGSGNWSCSGWTNLDFPSEWYSKAQANHTFIPYDIRSDIIPFADNSVDIIYCSHVIEHIENIYIKKMFIECFRVLKKGGIIRIACPDVEFLYEISKHDTDYWTCRHGWAKKSCNNQDTIRNVDFLVAEIAGPKMLQYAHSTNTEDYMSHFESLSMYDFFEYLTQDLKYRKEYPGDHINYWTFEKVKKMLIDAGFNIVIRSKWMGSCTVNMRNKVKFDTTRPFSSLYVEAIK
jgi:ubiquinone/menaquinone biosynthesis C-methylase UbiE